MVSSRRRKEVKLLGSAELVDHVVDRPPDVLGGSIELEFFEIIGTFYGYGDLIGVFRILCKISLEQGHAVVLWSSVEFGSAPEGAAIVGGGVHSFNGLL